MLESLHIENMAVIERLDVDFGAGLSVITGETGSGKSVMIDCLSFLLGGKAERDLVRSGAEAGTVSAVFSGVSAECREFLRESGLSDDGEELLLQRTLGADGKSKCRLNGRVIPQSMLRLLAGLLVSIHGQNDNQLIVSAATQKKVVLEAADHGDTLREYREAYTAYKRTREALSALLKDSEEAARLADILRFQIGEIESAALRVGEEEELLSQRKKLQNAEKITKQAEFVYYALLGGEKVSAALLLERCAKAVNHLAGVIDGAEEIAARLTNMRYEVEDIASTAADWSAEGEGDPTEALNRVEGRLDTISRLSRKYGADIPAILEFLRKSKERLDALENKEGEEERLTRLLEKQVGVLRTLSAALHKARVSAARELSEKVLSELAFLDMPHVRFEIAVREKEGFDADGCDEVEFCIATNKGEPLLPLSRIASGGELARIMLALRAVLNDRDGVGTAVFDEVDTGISGKTSRKIGIKLSAIARRTQVICITHSAQIASLATAHFKIAKATEGERARAGISLLDEEGRVAEVARILGGLSVTKAQTDAARDMIEEGRAYQ